LHELVKKMHRMATSPAGFPTGQDKNIIEMKGQEVFL
jgi:hypothetical protein